MLKEGSKEKHCVAGCGLTSLIHPGRDKRAVLLLQERRMVRELYCYSQPLVGEGGRTNEREFTRTVNCSLFILIWDYLNTIMEDILKEDIFFVFRCICLTLS